MSENLHALVAKLRDDDGISTPTFGDVCEAADLLEALAAQMSAVNAALDQYEADRIVAQLEREPHESRVAAAFACVSAVAKAVRS